MVAGDYTIGGFSIGETLATAMGVPYVVAKGVGVSRARYYPGATRTHVKLLAEPDTLELIGGQIHGGEGVKERADFLAFAAKRGATLEDLAWMENIYSPPIGALFEPMAIAAQNGLRARRAVMSTRQAAAARALGALPAAGGRRSSAPACRAPSSRTAGAAGCCGGCCSSALPARAVGGQGARDGALRMTATGWTPPARRPGEPWRPPREGRTPAITERVRGRTAVSFGSLSDRQTVTHRQSGAVEILASPPSRSSSFGAPAVSADEPGERLGEERRLGAGARGRASSQDVADVPARTARSRHRPARAGRTCRIRARPRRARRDAPELAARGAARRARPSELRAPAARACGPAARPGMQARRHARPVQRERRSPSASTLPIRLVGCAAVVGRPGRGIAAVRSRHGDDGSAALPGVP